MEHRPLQLSPLPYVILTHDDHVCRHPELSDQPSQPDRLGEAIVQVRLDDEEVDVAVVSGLPACVRAEQDHLRGATRRSSPARWISAGEVITRRYLTHSTESGPPSQRTFYEHFKNKEDAIVAALDSGSAHMLAAALPAFRRAPDWPHAVHDTQEAMFRWGAEEPEYARMGGKEMYAGVGCGERLPRCVLEG